jgi:hypothetical protein
MNTADNLSAPESKKGKLQRACLELLREHERDEDGLPTNGRFVFYELEQRGIVSKHSDGKRQPRQDVSDALMHLREGGIIPWWWIEDASRSVDVWRYSVSVYEYAAESIKRARIDLWKGEPAPVMLFESRAACRAISAVAIWFQMPLAAGNATAS